MPKDLTIQERVRLAASRYGKEAPSFDDVLAAITRDYGKDAHHTMLWHDLAKEAQAIPPSIKLDFKVCGHLLHHRGTCKCKGTVYTNRASAPDKETINDIVARYEAGDGLRDLAKDFGIAASRIRRYLKTRGVEVREQHDKRTSQQPFCIRRGCEQHVKGNALYCSLRCANKSTRGSARTCAADGCHEPTFRSTYKYCGTECRERARNG